MRLLRTLTAVGACAGLSLMIGITTPAQAADNVASLQTFAGEAHAATDFTSRKKRRAYRNRGYTAVPFAIAPPRWQARRANPNYGPGTRQANYWRSLGFCTIDEGYGRFSACSNN